MDSREKKVLWGTMVQWIGICAYAIFALIYESGGVQMSRRAYNTVSMVYFIALVLLINYFMWDPQKNRKKFLRLMAVEFGGVFVYVIFVLLYKNGIIPMSSQMCSGVSIVYEIAWLLAIIYLNRGAKKG